jgi:uncharacterized membrane protein required for colicin V production
MVINMMKWLFDIILCIILLISVIIGAKRGFLRSVWGLGTIIATIALTALLRPYAADMFSRSVIADRLGNYVNAQVSEKLAGAADVQGSIAALDGIYMLPEKYSEPINEKITASASDAASAVSAAVTDCVTDIAAAILLFIVIRLVLAIIYSILNTAFKFPLLKQTNRLAGAVAHLVCALVVMYVVFALAAISGTNVFNDTYICRFMYEHNILLNIFGL